MKERGSCGGTRGQTELDVLLVWGRGDGAPCENESIPGDCAWEGCSEDVHNCFKVPLYIANESGSGAHQDTKSFLLCALGMFGCAALCRKRHLSSPEGRRTEFRGHQAYTPLLY